jgi:hypothetical protein
VKFVVILPLGSGYPSFSPSAKPENLLNNNPRSLNSGRAVYDSIPIAF